MGEGRPIVVLHGGPELDHFYLLPELDRLAESFRLVYYDQRGRGRSAAGADPPEVSIDSELGDLDAVRRHFVGGPVALLGHSWGGLLAMEYAWRFPDRLTHLILLDTAPASAADSQRFREHLRQSRDPEDTERMRALAGSDRYQAGELEAELEFNRLHFKLTIRRPELLERLLPRLRAHFTPETVLAGREIERRLYDQTWGSEGYDLIPLLRELDVPTLVLHAEHDFIPVPLAATIAEAMPRARLVVLPACGHFTYLEQPDAVYEHVRALVEG